MLMMIILMIGVCATFVLWTIFYKKIWYRGLKADLFFAQSSTYEGEQAEIVEMIENTKKIPISVLEIAFHMPKALQFSDKENTSVSDMTYKLDVFSVLGKQRMKRHLKIDCTKRGYYSVNKIELYARSLFYHQRYRMEQAVDSSFYVYAKRINVSYLMSICEKMMGQQQCAKRIYEDPFAFSSIREYTITDPMKMINWKASAKTGEMMVNTYDSTQTQQIMIYLDLEDSGIMKQERVWEESIRIAASTAQKMIQRGISVGIAINIKPTVADESECEEYLLLSPSAEKKHLIKIEQMLARRTSEEVGSPFRIVLQKEQPDAGLLFISKNATRSQSMIEQALGKEKEGIWVLPVSEEDKEIPQTRHNLHVYRKEVARC